MDTPIPFDPDRFRSAAPHYFARTNYSPRLVGKVVAELALTRDDRVMDLGCGPGLLAIAFAPFVKEVVAIDPDAEMLAAGREAAKERRRQHPLRASKLQRSRRPRSAASGWSPWAARSTGWTAPIR